MCFAFLRHQTLPTSDLTPSLKEASQQLQCALFFMEMVCSSVTQLSIHLQCTIIFNGTNHSPIALSILCFSQWPKGHLNPIFEKPSGAKIFLHHLNIRMKPVTFFLDPILGLLRLLANTAERTAKLASSHYNCISNYLPFTIRILILSLRF